MLLLFNRICLLHLLFTLLLDLVRFSTSTLRKIIAFYNRMVQVVAHIVKLFICSMDVSPHLNYSDVKTNCQHSSNSSAALKSWSVIHLGGCFSALYNTTPSSMPPPNSPNTVKLSKSNYAFFPSTIFMYHRVIPWLDSCIYCFLTIGNDLATRDLELYLLALPRSVQLMC